MGINEAIVIGLGSMGKRRIRCLLALGIKKIIGVDVREDRRLEVEEKYGIMVCKSYDEYLLDNKPSIAIISLPPKLHVEAMETFINKGIPFFVEASVISDGLVDLLEKSIKKGVLVAPSCTLHFHPAIREISDILHNKILGKISNFHMHTGQYLPDWHTYEEVKSYYVSDPITGGAREIVPFELTWLTELFGTPRRLAGNYRKTININGAEYIDDTYNAILDFGSYLGFLSVDVVSRVATRRLMVNGELGQLIWDWNDGNIKIFSSSENIWKTIKYDMSKTEKGYNKNIGESMYIEEIKAFCSAVLGSDNFPNTLKSDINILKILEAIEKSDDLSCFINI